MEICSKINNIYQLAAGINVAFIFKVKVREPVSPKRPVLYLEGFIHRVTSIVNR